MNRMVHTISHIPIDKKEERERENEHGDVCG